MKSNTSTELFKLRWLLTPDRDDLILKSDDPDLTRRHYDLPPEAGEAWIETLAFPDGIVLYRAVHALEPSPGGQLIPLLDVDSASEEYSFSAQIWLSGLGCHHEYLKGRDNPPIEIIAFPGRDTFRHKKIWQAKVLIEGGVNSEMKSVVVPDGVMRSLLGNEAAERLLEALGLSAERPTVVLPMPMHVSAPLRDTMLSQFSGAARKLHAQARVLDYLAGLLNFVNSEKLPRGKHLADKKMEGLHSHLINLDGRMPTLLDLAKEFGVSARRLNADFTAKYGQSIYSFVTDHRLTQAHALLGAEPIPMKKLALRLGYSHVNHFSAAFKKKFGYPPGSLRSGR